MRNVVFAAPYPMETTMRFVRGVASLGDLRVLGVVAGAPQGPDRELYADLEQVEDGLSAAQLIGAVERLARRHGPPDRIIGVLEPLQEPIAAAREHFGVPGTPLRTVELFRDKARMKDALRAAGLPTARHFLINDAAQASAAAEALGFPMVLKPPAGQGAVATFRVRDPAELDRALAGWNPSERSPVLAEEFLQGREHSFDTLTLDGAVRQHSISHYRPPPLTVLETPWIQWNVLLPRRIDTPELDGVRELGERVIGALGLQTGFTHMEWFEREDGSRAVGEIAQRPPGANITTMFGLAHDIDPYNAWARLVIDERFDGPWERRYAVGCAYFRGIGRGRVVSVTGLDRAQREVGELVVETRLPKPGMPSASSYEGDGYAIVRAEDTETVEQALRTLINTVKVRYA